MTFAELCRMVKMLAKAERKGYGMSEENGSVVRDTFHRRVVGKYGAQLKACRAKLAFVGKAQPFKELSLGAEMKGFVVSNPLYRQIFGRCYSSGRMGFLSSLRADWCLFHAFRNS
jgi:hypothetical protein